MLRFILIFLVMFILFSCASSSSQREASVLSLGYFYKDMVARCLPQNTNFMYLFSIRIDRKMIDKKIEMLKGEGVDFKKISNCFNKNVLKSASAEKRIKNFMLSIYSEREKIKYMIQGMHPGRKIIRFWNENGKVFIDRRQKKDWFHPVKKPEKKKLNSIFPFL